MGVGVDMGISWPRSRNISFVVCNVDLKTSILFFIYIALQTATMFIQIISAKCVTVCNTAHLLNVYSMDSVLVCPLVCK
jgi:hypothetical protein